MHIILDLQTWSLCKYDKYMKLLFVLLFGENPQAVTYLAEPLCWSGGEISSPTTHRGAVWKDGAKIP